MNPWTSQLALDSNRTIKSGSNEALQKAISNAADLRIYTCFYYDEHLQPGLGKHELVEEVCDFRATYLVEGRWAAGIQTLRMPVNPPDGFGPRASMSFFMYNQDASQAIARPYLDGGPCSQNLGPSPLDDHSDMPKYDQWDAWDSGSNAPSSNFVYAFEEYRFYTCDTWQLAFHHDENGSPVQGSLKELMDAFTSGCEVKVGITDLCSDLSKESAPLQHEVFIMAGPGYYYPESAIFNAGTNPLVRVAPGMPMRYSSKNWDFGWLLPHTNGVVKRWLCDPYTLIFNKSESRHAIRWFVR